MWKMSCRLNFWRFLNGRNTFLKSLLRKLASLEQARLQLSSWGKWKEKFLWEEKLKVFFRSRSIHNSRLWSWRSNPFYSKYLPIRRELTPRRLYFFSFFEIFNQKPEFAECVYALRWLIIVNSYHRTSFRTFTIFPKISFRCSLESVKGLKKIESPFKSENTVSSIKKESEKTNKQIDHRWHQRPANPTPYLDTPSHTRAMTWLLRLDLSYIMCIVRL